MFCPHCGSKVLDESSICQSCGQEIIDFSGEIKAQMIGSDAVGTCLNCGASLGKDELFCGQCGTRVSTDASGATSVVAPSINRGSAPLRRTRGRSSPPETNTWGASRYEAPLDEYSAPTQAYHPPQIAHSAYRNAPGDGPLRRQTRSRPASSMLTSSGKPYGASPPRSHTALIIGLLCFLASFISAGTAIWLAVTALH